MVPVHDEVLSSVSFLFWPFTSVQAPPSQSSPTTHSLLDVLVDKHAFCLKCPLLYFLPRKHLSSYTSLPWLSFLCHFHIQLLQTYWLVLELIFNSASSISPWASLSALYSWLISFSFVPPIAAWCWAFNKHSANVGSVLNHPAELHNGPRDSLSLVCMWIRWDSHSLD